MATLQYTLKRATDIIDENKGVPQTLSHSHVAEDPREIHVERLETKLPELCFEIEEFTEDRKPIKKIGTNR